MFWIYTTERFLASLGMTKSGSFPAAYSAAEAGKRTQPHRVFSLLLFVAAGLAFTGHCAAQGKQTFTGTITDDMCPRADHSQMRMGPTDPECAAACIHEHGAVYVLFDGDSAFTLSDQRIAAKFVAQKVKVTGTLNAKTHTILVDSIAAAK